MNEFLVVVDIQNDFVDGALGTAEAVKMLDNAARKIEGFNGTIIVTLDTHTKDYMATAEGKSLPVPHCIRGEHGWQLNKRIEAALSGKEYHIIEKPTFGATQLPELLSKLSHGQPFTVTFIGLCTDICVVSNALMVKAFFPENQIFVDSACCAGVTPETNSAALSTMKMCQINII